VAAKTKDRDRRVVPAVAAVVRRPLLNTVTARDC
jgi:hypothetical protein